jgi:hypothetical protein
VRLLAEFDGGVHPLHEPAKPRPLHHLKVVASPSAVNLLGSVLNEQCISPVTRDTRRTAVPPIGYPDGSLTSTAAVVSD